MGLKAKLQSHHSGIERFDNEKFTKACGLLQSHHSGIERKPSRLLSIVNTEGCNRTIVGLKEGCEVARYNFAIMVAIAP